jgi:hypothetical protein
VSCFTDKIAVLPPSVLLFFLLLFFVIFLIIKLIIMSRGGGWVEDIFLFLDYFFWFVCWFGLGVDPLLIVNLRVMVLIFFLRNMYTSSDLSGSIYLFTWVKIRKTQNFRTNSPRRKTIIKEVLV